MNKNRTCPPEFIGENRDPRRYPAPNTPPKPKFIDALEITDDAEQYSTPVKKDPKTGLLYSNAEHLVNQSDAYHTAEEERLDAKIDEEAKDRYAHVMAIDEVNQHRVNEEKAARQAEDVLLNERIDDHEQKVTELHIEADLVHKSKLDKNFSNAEISTLPVSSSDYVVIVSNGNTYRVTLEQLATLISQKTDYFKGQFSSLEHLNSKGFEGLQGGDYAYVDTAFTDSEGNTYYQFVTYVWDVEDARWEETKSSQYATQADYTALVQSLLDGTFNLGSVKANSSPEESPLLTSLHVNQRDYSLPSVELEFSDQPVENGYNLGSIKIDDNVWNIPHDMLKIKVSSEKIEGATTLGSIKFGEDAYNIEKAFSPLVIGSRLLKGQALTKDIVENEHAVSDIYKFKTVLNGADNGYYTVQFNKDVEGQFNYIFTNTSGSSQKPFNTATLNVVGDYWEVVEITTVEGYRFGSFSDTGKKIKALENKVHSLENSGGGSGGITKNTYEVTEGITVSGVEYNGTEGYQLYDKVSVTDLGLQEFVINNINALKLTFTFEFTLNMEGTVISQKYVLDTNAKTIASFAGQANIVLGIGSPEFATSIETTDTSSSRLLFNCGGVYVAKSLDNPDNDNSFLFSMGLKAIVDEGAALKIIVEAYSL